jgi:2-C-methyl-D-erythritol 4-phosphate cytidylyltransferase
VRIVPGERTNIKVTHREDLDMVNALLEMQRDTRESV